MIKQKVQDALNKQLNEELYSSYEYLAMSAYFEQKNLTGMAHWYRLQSEEEYEHAMKIYDYIHQVDGKVELKEVKAPSEKWKEPIDIFTATYEQEKKVTEAINNIVDLTIEQKDHATNVFLQWFVQEQVGEESTALKLLDRMKLIGDNKNGLFLLDRELAQRQEQH